MLKHNQRSLRRGTTAIVAMASVVLCLGSAALAGTPEAIELNPARLAADTAAPANTMLAQAPAAEQPAAPNAEPAPAVDEAGSPFGLSLTYALYSDYVWRMVNLSEFAGEGREKLNHQLTVALSYDLGDFGTIGYTTWFEWYAAQKQLNPEWGGQNCQEVDYTLTWSYSFDPIKTDMTLGLTFFEFMNLAPVLRQDDDPGNNNDDRSQEIFLSLTHNDAWMWKWLLPNNEDPVLTPSLFLAQDIGALAGTWMEYSFSHAFAIPGIDNLTITPKYTLASQCGFWTEGCYFAGDVWSLITAYDLTPVLQLPKWAGSVVLTGDLYFSNPYNQLDDAGLARDEFWGGMTVTWSWGG